MAEEAGRIIALDVGDVRIGVAVSDPAGIIAQPVEVYKRVGYTPDCKYVLSLAAYRVYLIDKQYGRRVLLGLPLNMDGTRGAQAQKALDFGGVLENAGLRVYYQDERMTTMTAEDVLISGNVRREDRRRYVDKVAATVILEQWLASGGK